MVPGAALRRNTRAQLNGTSDPVVGLVGDGTSAEPVAGVDEVSFVSIGGGLASFAVVDRLRIAGVPSRDIRVVADSPVPYRKLQERLEASQVDRDGRMRSDSAARIDNPWGWPSYAMGEARRRHSIFPLLRVVGEPVVAEYFTPAAGQVYDGIDREAARISWPEMIVAGTATAVRPTSDGGYDVFVRRPGSEVDGNGGQETEGRQIIKARHVHIAVGYTRDHVATELASLHDDGGDHRRAVHAYEPHEHIFESLGANGGIVVVRGAGITAFQEIYRLACDRARFIRRGAPRVQVVHVTRHGAEGTWCDPFLAPAHSLAGNGFSFQHFVFPRGSGGGQLQQALERLPRTEREDIIRRLARPTAPRRQAWVHAYSAGLHDGWLTHRVADLDSVVTAESGRLRLAWKPEGSTGSGLPEEADYLIDATGLECGVGVDPLLTDLVDSGLAQANTLGRIAVRDDFVVESADPGALYASGPVTLGATMAAVDSFWGMQYAASEICDDLARRGIGRRLGPAASAGAWWRWMRGRSPR